MIRESLARAALSRVPQILSLQDRNPHSPTYGCFDRDYWHYATADFPCGMAQVLVATLSLAYQLPMPGNSFAGQRRVRDWAIAGMRFAARSAHADGSCDDYFLFERAGGATAFAFLACAEAYGELEVDAPDLRSALLRRGDWLAGHHEAGRLSNHQALIALGLQVAGRALGTDRWHDAVGRRVDKVLGWQHAEGWFQEYEGFDPGYQTLSIAFLARLQALRPTPDLRDALVRATDLVHELVHPDGSYAGEYGSRNTYNFFPHGFELVGAWHPAALQVNDRVVPGLIRRRLAAPEDKHVVGLPVWSYLLAWRDAVATRPASGAPRAEGRTVFPGAGIVIDRRDATELFMATNKGGVFKLFRDGRLVASDTQVSLCQRDGRVAVAHLVDDYAVSLDPDGIAVSGTMGWAKQRRMTPLRLVVLRLFMLAGGRWFSNVVRALLQRVLITGKKAAPFRFERDLRFAGAGLTVRDRIRPLHGWSRVATAAIHVGQTSVYVAMSRIYQEGQLLPGWDLQDQLDAARPGAALDVTRTL